MRRDLRRASRLLALPTLAFVAALAFLPGRVELVTRAYALVLAGVGLLLAVEALRRAYPPAVPLRALASGRSRSSPLATSLQRLEQHALLGVASQTELHHRLRPHLREIALGLFAARRRFALDDDPVASQRVLGDETWDLVRTDRSPPVDRHARGITPPELRSVVESLERI